MDNTTEKDSLAAKWINATQTFLLAAWGVGATWFLLTFNIERGLRTFLFACGMALAPLLLISLFHITVRSRNRVFASFWVFLLCVGIFAGFFHFWWQQIMPDPLPAAGDAARDARIRAWVLVSPEPETDNTWHDSLQLTDGQAVHVAVSVVNMSRLVSLSSATIRLAVTPEEGGFVAIRADVSAPGFSSAEADAVVYAAKADPANLKFKSKETIYLGGYLNNKSDPAPFQYLPVGTSPMSWNLPVLRPTQVDWLDIPATFSFVRTPGDH